MSFSTGPALRNARRAAGLSQEDLAARAGLSRMTVQKLEAGSIDPRMSTIAVLLRVLGLELMLVPAGLSSAVEDFLQSGGRIVAQPPGVGAPASIVEVLSRTAPTKKAKKAKKSATGQPLTLPQQERSERRKP